MLEFPMPIDFAPLVTWTAKFVQDNWQTTVSALSGTFLGAYFAFLFERRHANAKEREETIASAKSAQFAIWTQLNAAKNIKKQALDPKRDDPDRHLTLTPFTVHAKYPNLDVESLTFMLKDEGAQLLGEMMLSGYMFTTLIGTLEQRNIRHELMQQRISQLGPEVALDKATVIILKDMTDSIYGLGDDAVKQLQTVFESFRCYIEKKFPGVKGLSVGFLK
jgi:hypothetical protein